MGTVRNILFIMADQLRWDYLSYAGHPTLPTPNIDALAARGVNFNRTYCQSPICGPSRMSFYTGRYMFTHGSTWNAVPLNVGEWTMGDYLRPLGLRTALVGKTHFVPDVEGMKRLGIDPKASDGALLDQCGFEAFERDDGLHPTPIVDPNLAYNTYLRSKGYDSENPWHDFANSAEGPDGEILSGWHMRYADLPARVAEEHSETPYMANRAMDFIRDAGEDPWCMHLSFIKPHWPYVAPAPYHNMFGIDDIKPVVRSQEERGNPHPVIAAFMDQDETREFQRDGVIAKVIPTYMGLVKQIDDNIGRLMTFMEEQGRLDDTMIVFTSDHGDFLGDHWLGEKQLFHDPSARIPMVIVDPDPAADGTRGTVDERLVEAIDLLPTFIEVSGGKQVPHRLEGRSLMPLIRGGMVDEWRDIAFSEADYAFLEAGKILNVGAMGGHGFMALTVHWKYIFYENYRPQLFDVVNDADELHDLGESADHADIRADLHERLFHWLRNRRTRIGIDDDTIVERAGMKPKGLTIGKW